MYTRTQVPGRGRVTVPENYSGNAFTQRTLANEMPPPIYTHPSQRETPANDLPPSPPAEEEYSPSYTLFEEEREKTERAEKPITRGVGESIFSSLLPKGDQSAHFPFGHGIGSEEILILSLMLMVFLSGNENGETDSELLLLLGLLLFAG